MLKELANEAYNIANEHGWWSPAPTFGETVALCHSELSEALEEYRNNKSFWYYGDNGIGGVAVEMIDCMLRILSWCGSVGLDVDWLVEEKMKYNKQRPFRHGNKLL